MKIGTLLTVAIVSLSAVGGGLAVYVAATKYQTMDKISVAQRRLEIVRAVGDIPRYLNPERGFATNIMFGPPAVDPNQRAELNDKYRKQTDGAREKMNQIKATLPGSLEDGAAVASGMDALNVKFTALRETIDKALDGPAEARRDGAKKAVADNVAFNSAVTALLDVMTIIVIGSGVYLWWVRQRRRYQRQPLQKPRRRQARGDGGRKTGFEPLPGQERPDPVVAAGIARQSRDAGQRGSGAHQDERSLCRAFRSGAEAGEGRRHQRQIRARRRHLLCGVATRSWHDYRGARRLLRQRRTTPQLGLFRRALQLPGGARGAHRGRKRKRRPRDDGPSPRLQADRRPDRHDVASCERRRLRRDFGERARRRDRRDGGGRAGLQGQHDQGGPSGR